MARGEPPGRRRTYPSKKKGGDNAVIEWMKSYLTGLAGPFAGAADPTANIASQAGAFVPNQQLSAGGRINADVTREAINQRAMEAYDPATMQAGGGILAAGMAATAFRRPGAALRLSARQIAKQRAMSNAKMGRPAPRQTQYTPEEMRQAAEAAQRASGPQSIPPRGFPAGQTPRTDAPTPNFNARPKPARSKPQPPAAPEVTDTRVTDAGGSVNVERVLTNGLNRKISKGENKGKSQGLTRDQVSTTWDGKSEPKAAQFKKVDSETGKKSSWYEGYRSAKKSWETLQKKSDPRNPNANPVRAQAAESQMTPDELDALQRAKFLDENPQVRVQLEEAAYNDYVTGGGKGFDEIRRLMQEMPFGNRPSGKVRNRPPSRQDSTRKTYTTRKAVPKQRPGESDEAYARRVARHKSLYTKPVRRKGESQKAFEKRDQNYNKRMEKLQQKQDEAANRNQPDRTDNPAPFSRNPFQDPERIPGSPGRQPDGGVSRKANDPNAPQDPRGYRPSWMGPDERTYYPSYLYGDLDVLPDARAVADSANYAASMRSTFSGAAPVRVNPLDLPRFTPTRGKGSTRLRNVTKAAKDAEKSNVADKPAAKKPSTKKKGKDKPKEEAPEEVPIPKRSKPSRAEKPEFANKSVDDSRTKKKFGPERPKQQKPKADTESPRDAGEKPRSYTGFDSKKAKENARRARAEQTAGSRKPSSGDPGDAEEARLRGMAGATEEAAKKNRVETPSKPETPRISFNKKQKTVLGLAALAGAGKRFKDWTDAQETVEDAVEEAVEEKPTKKAQAVLRDKYGRKITREEYDRREAFRKKLEGMSAEEKKAARKKEMKRRETWRKTLGKQLFGKAGTKAFRNLDLKEGVSSREVNKLMLEAYGKSGSRQAAMDIRKKKKFARAK